MARRDSEPTLSGHTTAPVLWQGDARNRVLWAAAFGGLGVVALGAFLAVEPARDVVLANIAVAGCLAAGLVMVAATAAFTKVRVRIDRDHVHVRCGHLGLPRRRIPVEQVLHCSEAQIAPQQWGGWGARWRPDRGDAVVVRRGPGLVLELGDGKRFTVTVDDAGGAHRVLSTILAGREAETPRTTG